MFEPYTGIIPPRFQIGDEIWVPDYFTNEKPGLEAVHVRSHLQQAMSDQVDPCLIQLYYGVDEFVDGWAYPADKCFPSRAAAEIDYWSKQVAQTSQHIAGLSNGLRVARQNLREAKARLKQLKVEAKHG